MITSALIHTIAFILDTVFSVVPTVNAAPDWWINNVSPALGVMSGINTLPIIGTIIEIGILTLTFMAAWQGVVATNWLYNKIRGSG